MVGSFLILAYAPQLFQPGFLLTSGDGGQFFFPGFQWLRQQVPFVPLWTDALGGGYPLVDESQLAAYYPIQWLALAAPDPARGYNLYQLAHLGLLFFTSFLLFQFLTGSRTAALVGAAALAFSGQVLGRLDHPNQPITYAWVPLIYYLTLSWLRDGLRRTLALAGIAWGFALLAGHSQIALFAGLGLVPVVIFAAGRIPGLPAGKRLVRALTALALPPLLGGLLAGVQLIPFLQLYAQSVRAGGLAANVADNVNLSPWNLLLLVYPFIFGNPGGFWLKARYLAEASCYLGLVPLIFALAAAGNPRRDRRSELIFWLAFTILFGLLAAGSRTPLYPLLHALPILSGAIGPIRYLFVAQLGLAALAAFGVVIVRERPRAVWFGLIPVIVVALAVFAGVRLTPARLAGALAGEVLLTPGEMVARLPGAVAAPDLLKALLIAAGLLGLSELRARPRLLFLGLAVLLVADGASFARRLLQPTRLAAAVPAAVRGGGCLFHLGSVDDDSPNRLLPSGSADFDVYTNLALRHHAAFRSWLLDLDPLAFQLARITEVHCPEPVIVDGQPFAPRFPLGIVEPGRPLTVPCSGSEGETIPARLLLAFIGTRELPAGALIGEAVFTRDGETVAVFPLRLLLESGDLMEERAGTPRPGGVLAWRDKEEEFYIRYYRADLAVPPAAAPDALTVVGRHPEAGIVVGGIEVAALDFYYPWREDLPLAAVPDRLAARTLPGPLVGELIPDLPRSAAAITLLASAPEYRAFRVAGTSLTKYLRLAAWYPEWECRLDGEPVPLRLAAEMFQGVTIPGGAHLVEFVYARRAVHAGLALTILAGLVCLALVFSPVRIDNRWNRGMIEEMRVRTGNRYPVKKKGKDG